jgi:CRISPR-associated protein Csd1
MILQALANYYERKNAEGTPGLEPEGFKNVEIPFLIVIKKDGSFAAIEDTRSRTGNRLTGRNFLVPKVFEGSRTGNVEANLLWDKASYVFGAGTKTDRDRLVKQKAKFREIILKYFPNYREYEGVSAVLAFLDKFADQAKKDELWDEICDSDPNLGFKLDGKLELICSSDQVRHVLAERKQLSEKGICLITGREEQLVRLENPIKGLRGSGKAESHLVSFNESAYWSYGKTKDRRQANAPIGKTSSSAYVAAINYLKRKDSKQVMLVGDATTLFWGGRKNKMEDLFADLFGEPAKDNPDQLTSAVKNLYSAPTSGAPPLDEDYTPFFVLGLAPNAARIAVRFWHAGTVGETARRIRRHFEDCAVIRGPNQPEYLSFFRLLVSTASQGKADNIVPNLGGEFMKAILAGTPYPLTLLSAAVRRCRAEREITYSRAALIKGVLAREARYYQKMEKEVGMGLDPGNMNVGYRLGRLFAVLEKAQEEANPGINATILDRFYGAASSTPVAAFPHLMKLKNHHLSKLENRGRAVNLEKAIGEIVCGIEDFPAHLSLHDQGRFAVGYYHQRQDFFKKHETTNENL